MSTTTALNNLFIDIVKRTADPLLKGEPVLTPLVANKYDEVPGQKGKKIKVPVPEMPDTIGTFTRGDDVTLATRTAATFKEVEIETHVCDDYPVYNDERAWMYLNPEQFFTLKLFPRWQALIRQVERAAFAKHILLHGHCHQKALASLEPTRQLLALPTNYAVEVIPSGCCGMAGSFGYEREHFAVSMQIGELVLFPAVRAAAAETLLAAPGTSCRHQIKDGTGRIPQHPIEILRNALRYP